MSATARQLNVPEGATALWRVAESGDLEELRRLLPDAGDVNVRNRHGMTALMRAASHGHEPVARLLLQHGADPNLKRNDKFTALALAAFFGHAETVKTLIEFGARPEVVTRCGASARAWAAARTFVDLARSLETPHVVPIAKTDTPAPKTHAREPLAVVVPVVKTLKDPPEIWDLVHEVPRGFDPRSAFISRIASMKQTFVVGAFAVLLLVVAGGVGALVLRKTQAPSLPVAIPGPPPSTVQTTPTEPAPAQAAIANAPVEVVNDNHVRGVSNKARLLIRQPRPTAVINEEPVVAAQTREAPAVATPKFESPKPTQPAVKTNPAPLSPNLITPSKNSPAKAKVIQWP
jgi:membrane-associated phospholipid phosphatase